MTPRTIVRAKGGTRERRVSLASIKIPDLWHIANKIESITEKEKVLEVWQLAHDLLRTLREEE